MPTEIEIKLKVDSHQAVRERLRAAGAEPGGRIVESNRIFDNAERTLLAGDCGLRIRECHDPQGKRLRTLMTYKGAKQPGPIKRREEIEFDLDDPAAGAELLGVLGFTEVIHFEKHRESWRLHGCAVELDEIPHLGTFVEIEGPDEAGIRRVQEAIGLGAATPVRRSYIALLVKHCRENHLPVDSIRF